MSLFNHPTLLFVKLKPLVKHIYYIFDCSVINRITIFISIFQN